MNLLCSFITFVYKNKKQKIKNMYLLICSAYKKNIHVYKNDNTPINRCSGM